MVRLLEVFKDFEVKVRGKSFHSQYDAEYIVVPKKRPKKVTLEDLKNYVRRLQQRYPQRNFKLRKYKNFYIITQQITYVDEETKRGINALRRRLRSINRRLLPSVIDRYERIILSQKLNNLRRRVKRRKDVIPIYIDLENQKFYVPKSYVEKRRKLTNYIIMRTLGTLGVSTSKYNGRW